ncbi:hypothetical protein [Pluralibacter sp.]|uniref:hypothetical protein n=1 Tax=Pluralibacter sp. TaxID=1920032 RepID=UPI0025D2001E|nr:hypothetical protein [Pluralibacter sp.]MBV8041087.1 hypothetical protein [Pluralibacter sp.]
MNNTENSLKSINSIIYYLELQSELSDPLFRYATFRSHIIPEIKCLKSYKESLNIKVIISNDIYDRAVSEGLDLTSFDVIKIESRDIDNICGDNFSASMRWSKGELLEGEGEKIRKLISSKIGDHYPDITITYESPSPFMKLTFPDAVHFNSMFGAFSRAPFPAFGIIDPYGLYNTSFQAKFIEKLKHGILDSEQLEVLRVIRRDAIRHISKNFPYKKFLAEIYDEYDAAYIVACQIDNYFAFNACTDIQTQYELVKYALVHTPQNIAVIVTEHNYCRQITNKQVDELKAEFSNFIYLENNKDIPGPSQFLLPYVDGGLTVSSSIAYQCSLWRKPLITIGSSHVSIMSTAKNIDEFINQVSRTELINNDVLLYNLLSKVHLSHKFDIFHGENYYLKLNELYNLIIENNHDEIFSQSISAQDLHKRVWEGRRGWLLDKEISIKNIETQTDHLRVAMSEVDAISFDLFDTLAERDFIDPHELFLFIEPKVQQAINNRNFKFHHIRRQAEGDVRRPTQGHFEVTIDQIYERIGEIANLNDDQLEIIKKIEMQSEFDLVHAKARMVKEFKFAELICSVRAIITDIYFEKNFIEKIVEKIGLKEHVNILLSSATSKTRKHNGTIYPEYLKLLKQYDISASKALHVGDNKIADGDMAKKNNLRSYVFPKAMDNYRRAKIATVLERTFSIRHSSTSIINGIFANKFNSDHWNKFDPDNTFSGSPYKYGYMAIGPMILGFTQWLYRKAKQSKTEHLYFLARDGWILKQSFDKLYGDKDDAPITHYLYASRRAVTLPSIKTIDDIIELASQNFNARSISSFLNSRFDIEWNEIPLQIAKKFKYKADSIVTPSFEINKLHRFLNEISDIIFTKATNERNTLLEYLEQEGFIGNIKNKNTAVVDIGYSGSMQFYLGKILSTDSIGGYYFLTHNHSRNHFNNALFEGYLQDLDDHKIAYRHQLNDHVFIFEAALSSLEGSLINITREDNKLKLNLLDAEEEKTRKPILKKIHSGATDFINDIKDRFCNYNELFEVSPLLSTRLILDYANYPSPMDAAIFDNFEVENIFGGGSVWLIAKPDESHFDTNGHIKPDVIDRLIEQSKWKNGARQRYKMFSLAQSTNLTTVQPKPFSGKKGVIVDIKNKKKAKLKNTPYRFFSDSKKPLIKNLSWLFKPQTSRAKVLGFILKKIIH